MYFGMFNNNNRVQYSSGLGQQSTYIHTYLGEVKWTHMYKMLNLMYKKKYG